MSANLSTTSFASAERTALLFQALMEHLGGDYPATTSLWVLLHRQADMASIPTSTREIHTFSNGSVAKNTAGRALDRLVSTGVVSVKKHPNTTTEIGVRSDVLASWLGRFGAMIDDLSLPQNVPVRRTGGRFAAHCGDVCLVAEVTARLSGDYSAARVLAYLRACGAEEGYVRISRRKMAEQVQDTVTERAARLALERLEGLELIERRIPNTTTELRIRTKNLSALLEQPLPFAAVLPGITPLDDALARILGPHSYTTQEGEPSHG